MPLTATVVAVLLVYRDSVVAVFMRLSPVYPQCGQVNVSVWGGTGVSRCRRQREHVRPVGAFFSVLVMVVPCQPARRVRTSRNSPMEVSAAALLRLRRTRLGVVSVGLLRIISWTS